MTNEKLPFEVIMRASDGSFYMLTDHPQPWAEIGVATITTAELRELWRQSSGKRIPEEVITALLRTKRAFRGGTVCQASTKSSSSATSGKTPS